MALLTRRRLLIAVPLVVLLLIAFTGFLLVRGPDLRPRTKTEVSRFC
jgi:hypothetical protein